MANLFPLIAPSVRQGYPLEAENLFPRHQLVPYKETLPILQALSVIVLVVCSATGNAAGTNERVYYFVDESGVSHYSNVQMDPRYTVIGTDSRRLPATAQSTGEPEPPTPGQEAPLSIAPPQPEEEPGSSDR